MPSSASLMRRALVVEDDAITRSLLQALLVVAHFEVRTCANAREALAEFEQFDPDVLIVDIELAEQPNGAQLASLLAQSAPHLAVVVVSHYPSPGAAGSRHALPPRAAFVNKEQIEHASVLLDAVESVLDDGRQAVVRSSPEDAALAALTPVQLEVLQLLALGLSNDEIARRRGVAKRAAERSVQRLYGALGLGEDGDRNPRVEAARIYVRAFGLPADPTG